MDALAFTLFITSFGVVAIAAYTILDKVWLLVISTGLIDSLSWSTNDFTCAFYVFIGDKITVWFACDLFYYIATDWVLLVC